MAALLPGATPDPPTAVIRCAKCQSHFKPKADETLCSECRYWQGWFGAYPGIPL